MLGRLEVGGGCSIDGGRVPGFERKGTGRRQSQVRHDIGRGRRAVEPGNDCQIGVRERQERVPPNNGHMTRYAVRCETCAYRVIHRPLGRIGQQRRGLNGVAELNGSHEREWPSIETQSTVRLKRGSLSFVAPPPCVTRQYDAPQRNPTQSSLHSGGHPGIPQPPGELRSPTRPRVPQSEVRLADPLIGHHRVGGP